MGTSAHYKKGGGESGIRTHGRCDTPPVFKTGSFNRSDISPLVDVLGTTIILAHPPGLCQQEIFVSGKIPPAAPRRQKGPAPVEESPDHPGCAPAPDPPAGTPAPADCRKFDGNFSSPVQNVYYDKISVVFIGGLLYNLYVGRRRPPGLPPARCTEGGESGGVNDEPFRCLPWPVSGGSPEGTGLPDGKG